MKDFEIIASKHSEMRMKERIGMKNSNASRRMVQLAFERGQRAEDIRRAALRNYIAARNERGAEAVAYNGYCFLFNPQNGVCITVYPLPKELCKQTFGREMPRKNDWTFSA